MDVKSGTREKTKEAKLVSGMREKGKEREGRSRWRTYIQVYEDR